MFRTSLKILIGAVLLVLAAIVAYSALGLSGPDESMAEAEERLQHRDYASALNILNLTERSVERDPVRRERLWRLRYATNTEFGDAAGALRDLDNLLRDRPGDVELRLDRIRLLALAGDGPGARLAAIEFLSDRPNHGRALELAGEACQTVYQPQLRDLRSRLDRDLGASDRGPGRDAMLSFLCRPDGDPEVEHASAELQRIYSRETRLQALWDPLWQDLQRVRGAVQEGLGFFQRSLEADGSPVAAFRAVTWAYSQSGRTDDLLMECEIQRRRFDHEYVAEAGATAAWSLLRDDLMGAARATAARWLPKGAVQRLLAKNWSETGTNDLLLAAGYAAWVQRDTAAVTAIWSDANALVQAKRPTGRTLAVTSAFANRVWDNKEHLLPSLRWGADAILRSPAPIAEVDLASPFANDWLRALDERGADEATIQSALRAWATGRPDSPEPLVALAEFLARTGRAAAALTAIDAALRLAPDDERILARRLAIARVHYADSELGGPALLGQCLRRGALAPEVADPIGALLCAEAAMAQSLWPIAMTSASAAVDEMPYLRAARETEVRAYLGAGRAVDAARLARRLLELLPADAAGVQLAFAAHEAAGLPIADLLFRAMPNSAPTPPLQAALLRATAEAEPDIGARFATPFALQTGSPVELRILAAQALARAGRAEAATTELTRLSAVAAELSANQRSDLLQAWVACLVASAAQQPDAALVARFPGALTAIGDVEAADSGPLVAAAHTLAPSHPRLAHAMVGAALPAVPTERRDADLYLLAGRLAARCGAWRLAADHLTAALGFAGGERGAEELARLCLAQGDLDRAAQLAVLTVPRDAALVASLGQLEIAQSLLTAELLRDRGDLLAHGLMAVFGQPSLSDWPPLRGPAAQERLELLAILHDAATAPLALARLEALVAAEPQGRTNRLLLARALLHAGRPERAAALHGQLHAEGAGTMVLWREAALASTVAGYTIDPALRLQILSTITNPEVMGSLPTLWFAGRGAAEEFTKAGMPAQADDTLLRLLVAIPLERAMTPAELDLVARLLPPFQAWQLLERELLSPAAEDRGDLLDRLHTVAPLAMAADPNAVAPVLAAAWNHVDSDGPRGSIVHFLRRHDPRLGKQVGRAADLLRAHLQRVAAGRESTRWLSATVAGLVECIGVDTTLLELDTALQRHPTTLALWLERAQLLVGSRGAGKGLDELRGSLQHADCPELQVERIALAAEMRHLTADDETMFAQLPAALRESPLGAHTAAMLALRRGAPEAALALFARGAPRRDGMHLFAAALAWLQCPASDGPERAAELLQQLARDYPNSSLARNAGSFARQLAPR